MPPSPRPTTSPPGGARRRRRPGRARSRGSPRRSSTGRPIAASAAAESRSGVSADGRLAGVDEVAHGAADDLVRAAVVEPGVQGEDVGDVGGGDEALARDLLEALGVQLEPVEHRRGQPRDRDGLVERARHGAVQQVEVVGARRARVQRDERGGDVAGGLPGLRADRGERVRVLLLRHQRARAAVRVGELDEPELLARVDLEVLAELALVGRGDRERREQLDVDVGLPGGVLRVLDERRRSRAARRAARGRAPSASRRCRRRPRRSRRARRTGRARAPRRAGPGRRRRAAGGRPWSAGPAAGRCSRWRAPSAWRARGATSAAAWSASASCSSRTPSRAISRSADPERLAARPSGAEPARGRAPDAPLELGLARVEGVAERGIPGELVAGDRVQLEQPAQERLSRRRRAGRRPRRARPRAPGRRARGRARAAARGRSRPRRRRRRARPRRRRAGARLAPAPIQSHDAH